MIKQKISYQNSIKLLKRIVESDILTVSWKAEKDRVTFKNEAEGWEAFFKYPALFPKSSGFKETELGKYCENIEIELPFCALILIQAGSASLGVFDDEGDLLLHKGIQKYMVRKKRGKSQLTYLRQKGKSRYGSRLRLQEGLEFFEEINRKLLLWKEELNLCEHWFYAADVRLWNELFNSKEKPFFERGDNRFKKIPFDVNIPKFKELSRIYYLLKSGFLEYKEEKEELVYKSLNLQY